MRKVIVIAGSIEQFHRYLRENNLSEEDAVYASHAEKILGVEASEVVAYGTYYERKDHHKLMELALTRIK